MHGRAVFWVFAAVVAGLLGLLLAGGLSDKPAAPDVRLTAIGDGTARQLSALAGQTVIVNFWATSCAPCVRELPQLADTYREYAGRGLAVWAVAMPYDRPDLVADFAARFALPFPVALDLDGAIANAFDHVALAPTTFLIDRQGRIVKRWVGTIDFADLHARLDATVDPAAAAAPLPSAEAGPARPVSSDSGSPAR